MHRVDLYAPDGGLGLVVTGRDMPHLRFEVASGRRLLLRQQGRVVLLGKVHRWSYGVHVYRTGGYRSPLPALRADHARQVTHPGTAAWFDRSAHQFASWLDDAEAGPLHNGFWILRPRTLPPYCLRGDLTEDHPAAYLDWFGEGWNGVLPLRQLPDAEAARVMAYRRQAREQVLPPILLWSVSGFDGYLLIDGHCRLAAALAEGIEPSVLVLAIGSDPETDQEGLDQAATGHIELMDRVNEQAVRQRHDARRAADALTRQFAAACAGLPGEGRTRAWP
ncbi:hypothetical protein DLE60_19320 [Micromonospora globispora]|uniref:ParB/Sulfiredoxin domain-containing protein n=1 Tax=Micromonospora globispora TaxID=1450148 RepID=A0A317JY69_9ACTN|nr:hypothetical protein [Micromonospora globispora]PWU45716.1 hypothetical protein DLJ46_20430 [Micromonospora globispora]PWU58892.1 hypothetical protein DLE60_19320 [Micromonospora globispora]